MNRLVFILVWLVGMACGGFAQTSTSPNEGSQLSHDASTGIYSLYWWGRTGNTYFIQHSEDLTNWIYFPEIKPGLNAVLGENFQTNAAKFFVRLRISNIPTTDPFNADFDGDHVSNQDELLYHTDPLSSQDTDINGFPDDWEIRYFGHLGVDRDFDSDGDGVSNLQEWTNRTDPTDYFNGILPELQISIGDNQSGLPSEYLSLPLGVRVVDSAGGALANAPVTFNIISGNGHISTDAAVPALASTISVRSDGAGYAFVYYQQPSNVGIASQIAATATSGSNVRTVTFAASTVPTLTPSNNDFADAQVITGTAGSVVGFNPGATKQTGEPNHANRPCSTSIWYKWQAPASGNVRFDTDGSSFDTVSAVYTGASIATLTELAANDDDPNTPEWTMTSKVTFRAVAGTSYYIAVDGFRGQTGKIALQWLLGGGPANDYFANAQAISGYSGSIAGSNANGTKEPNEPNHAGENGRTSVWYVFQPATTGQITITTTGSDFDTLCAVYTGSSVSGLTVVSANDDEVPDQTKTSKLVFQAVVGTTYRIAVDGYSGATGNIVLNWNQPAPPINDNFGNPVVLTGSSGNSSGSNKNASKELDEPNHAGNSGGASVWYRWQAPDDGNFTFNTSGSTFDTVHTLDTVRSSSSSSSHRARLTPTCGCDERNKQPPPLADRHTTTGKRRFVRNAADLKSTLSSRPAGTQSTSGYEEQH